MFSEKLGNQEVGASGGGVQQYRFPPLPCFGYLLWLHGLIPHPDLVGVRE
jgi:hypothetical protein